MSRNRFYFILKIDWMSVPDTANPLRHVQRRAAVQFLGDDKRENQNAFHSFDHLWRLCRYALSFQCKIGLL